MPNNIHQQTSAQVGCETVTATALPTGQYCALQFVTEGSLASLTPVSTTLTGGTYTGVTYPAGFVLFTPFTAAEPSAGVTVVAYKAL